MNLWILIVIDKVRSSYELIIPRIAVEFKFMRKTVSSEINKQVKESLNKCKGFY